MINKLNDIPKLKRKGCILLGKGPGLDSLDLKALQNQTEYDIMSVSDAHVICPCTYAIHYHVSGLIQSFKYIDNIKYLLLPEGFYYAVGRELDKRAGMIMIRKLLSMNTKYLFENFDVSEEDIFEGNFPKYNNKGLFKKGGTTIGALYFLLSYMQYKKIRHIGFEGGNKYAKILGYNLKPKKAAGAAVGYNKCWEYIQKIMKFYPDVSLQPLMEYLK